MSWLRTGLVLSIVTVMLSLLFSLSRLNYFSVDSSVLKITLDMLSASYWTFGLVLLGVVSTQIVKYQEVNGRLKPVTYSTLGWVLNVFAITIPLYTIWGLAEYFIHMDSIRQVGLLSWVSEFAMIVSAFGSYFLIGFLCLTWSRQLSLSLAPESPDH